MLESEQACAVVIKFNKPDKMKNNIPTTKCPGAYRPKYRAVLIVLLFLAQVHALVAQRNLSLYHLNAAPQSYSLNPGRMPMSNSYFAIPALGNIGANFNNTGFNYASIIPEADTTGQDQSFFDNAFDALLSGLKPENRLLLDFNAGLLDFGKRAGRNFFSFSASENINLQLDYPKAVFELFNEIDLGDTASAAKLYDLSSLGLNLLHYRSYALGFTRQITPNLSAGARIKYLNGIGSIFTQNNSFQFENDAINAALNINGSLEVSSSGLSALVNNGSSLINYLTPRGNTGMAFDIGVSYSTDKLDLSASILNIGRIIWKNDLTSDGISSARFQFPTDDLDAFEAEFNRFTDSISFQRDSQAVASFQTTLPAIGYLGANYYLTPQTSANLLLSPRYYNGNVDIAYAVGVQTRISKILQVGVNYSAYNTNVNIGASANLNLGPLQVFAATDNLPAAINWQNAANAHINAGLSLVFNSRSRSEQLALWEPQEKEPNFEDDDFENMAAMDEDEQYGPKDKKNLQGGSPSAKPSKPAKDNRTENARTENNIPADEFLGEEWMDESNASKKSKRNKNEKPTNTPAPVNVAANKDPEQAKEVEGPAAKKSKNSKATNPSKDPAPTDFYTTNEFLGEEWMDESNTSKKQKQSKKDTPISQKSKETPASTEVAEAPMADKKQEKKNDDNSKDRKANKKDQVAPSQPAPVIVMRKYFSFRGAAKDVSNGEILKGVRVDAYVQLPDGKQQLAFTRNFFNGDFEVLMERDKTYRIIIHKDAFSDHELTITPDQMLDKNELLQDVQLKK
jgi:hypothetical protein